MNKPYLYKGKAYKRNDTLNQLKLIKSNCNRLTLLGLNQYYDELKARNQDLEFKILEKRTGRKIIL